MQRDSSVAAGVRRSVQRAVVADAQGLDHGEVEVVVVDVTVDAQAVALQRVDDGGRDAALGVDVAAVDVQAGGAERGPSIGGPAFAQPLGLPVVGQWTTGGDRQRDG